MGHVGLNFRVRPAKAMAALACVVSCLALAAEVVPDTPLKVPQPNTEQKPLFVPVERPMPSSDAPGTYQMRCWQRGQLLFTENNLSEPTIAAMPGRVVSFNEKSANAVYMLEVAESLCLIKRGKVGR
jgi:hypothetical protein